MSIVVTHPLVLMPYNEVEIAVINLATEHRVEEVSQRMEVNVTFLAFSLCNADGSQCRIVVLVDIVVVSGEKPDQNIRASL